MSNLISRALLRRDRMQYCALLDQRFTLYWSGVRLRKPTVCNVRSAVWPLLPFAFGTFGDRASSDGMQSNTHTHTRTNERNSRKKFNGMVNAERLVFLQCDHCWCDMQRLAWYMVISLDFISELCLLHRVLSNEVSLLLITLFIFYGFFSGNARQK